ncbi:head completion/stabilization protein [Solimicrobium silvestre]|nr:head completion/stabilization protein [Solimicrobium silvestre]
MSFSAFAPPTNSVPDDQQIVENDGWFPAIHLSDLREAARLDGTVTDARLTPAVVTAMLAVNQALAEWQARQRINGWSDLASVPAPTINRESQYLAHYRRAVYSTTKADLLEKYRDYDSTASSMSDKKAMEWLDTAPEQERRNAHWAIANILQQPHMTVELI